jgi:outer membrane protein assembly factor BamB
VLREDPVGAAVDPDELQNADGIPFTPRPRVFALKADTGELLWQYRYPRLQPGQAGGMNFVQNRGVAVGSGMVIFGTTEITLVALDATTSKESSARRGR